MRQHKQPHHASENSNTQLVAGERRGGALPIDLSTLEISCVFIANDTGNKTESVHRENLKNFEK